MAQAIVTEYAEVVEAYRMAYTNRESSFLSLVAEYKIKGEPTNELVQDMGQTINDLGQMVVRLEHQKNLLEVGAHPNFDPSNARSVSDWSLTISAHRKNLERQENEWDNAYTRWSDKIKGN